MALIPCVVCDEPLRTSMSVWRGYSNPAVICHECLRATDRRIVRQLYILRRQVRQIHLDTDRAVEMVQGIKQDFDELYQMHVELSERSS